MHGCGGGGANLVCLCVSVGGERRIEVEGLLYVHRNRMLIRDESPGRPPRLSHTS